MEKINILLTGKSGFLGKELEVYLGKKYNILDLNRFDLTDSNLVEQVLKENRVDVVLHTATKGGKRTEKDTVQDLIDNLTMFNNLIKLRDQYKALFCFCSGAAYDRALGVDNISEEEILNRNPSDYYGLSKNIIARESLQYDNIFTFRLFGCFGNGETSARFFSSLRRNMLESKPMIIHQDREMDFFSTEDVSQVILYYLENYNTQKLPKDINLVYSNKLSLSALANKFREVVGAPTLLIRTEQRGGSPYTGNGEKLKSLNIKLRGLSAGIRSCYGGALNASS